MKCDRLSLVKRRGEVKSRRSAFAVSILINGTTPRISRRSLLIDDLASLTHISSCVIRHTYTHTHLLTRLYLLLVVMLIEIQSYVTFLQIIPVMRGSKYLMFGPLQIGGWWSLRKWRMLRFDYIGWWFDRMLY